MAEKAPTPARFEGELFTTTHWSVVLNAQTHGTPQAKEALAQLCQTYWYPVYAYVCKLGHGHHQAQDLTQGYFLRLLDQQWLDGLAHEKGRLRSFLVVSIKNFVANEWDRERALKRGGGQQILSLDEMDVETRYKSEPTDNLTPEKVLDQCWARALLERALSRLRGEMVAAGKSDLFEALKPCLEGEPAETYAQIGARLSPPRSEGDVRTNAYRMRQRYPELVREEIAHTVSCKDDIEDELQSLWAALS
jgi:RNA polymerase sigma-70 factor (ECF subfamily)